MGSRNRTNKKHGFFTDNYWQSSAYNQRVYSKNLNLLASLALNRFRWVGLPDTCDARFLELQLHKNGMATICHAENMPDVWQTLIASPYGEFNAYGNPIRWRATGYNQTNYDVDLNNGDICFYSNMRVNIWNALEIFARKLTHYERTEDVNLSHQQKPYILIAPREQQQQIANLYKQIAGGEPAIFGNSNLENIVDKVKTIDTKVPFIAEDLARAYQNTFNQALLYLGIPHLAFEKGERMIEDEARANTASTNIALMDCMQSRRDFCNKMKRFGLDLHVYFNDDFESYNFNYTSNVEAMAQDKLIIATDEALNVTAGDE